MDFYAGFFVVFPQSGKTWKGEWTHSCYFLAFNSPYNEILLSYMFESGTISPRINCAYAMTESVQFITWICFIYP